MPDTFAAKVIEITNRIPRGKVATYGQIAGMAGSPRAAKTVGQILNRQSQTHNLPWQRVINRQGRISIATLEYPAQLQAELLGQDGVKVEERDGSFWVDLKKYLW